MSKKRSRNRTANELEKLEKQVRSALGERGREVRFQENVGERMSDVIDEFVKPYEQYADSVDAYRRLIATAIIAWNAALVQGAEREELLNEMFQAIAPHGDRKLQEDFYSIVREMIERKEKYFANNRRYIMDYQVTETPTGLHLSIASTPK